MMTLHEAIQNADESGVRIAVSNGEDPNREMKWAEFCAVLTDRHRAMVPLLVSLGATQPSIPPCKVIHGGNHEGAAAYDTVANGRAPAIVPHCEGARLIRLCAGTPYYFATWLSIAPGHEDDDDVTDIIRRYTD
jgi:hypothetical protein